MNKKVPIEKLLENIFKRKQFTSLILMNLKKFFILKVNLIFSFVFQP